MPDSPLSDRQLSHPRPGRDSYARKKFSGKGVK